MVGGSPTGERFPAVAAASIRSGANDDRAASGRIQPVEVAAKISSKRSCARVHRSNDGGGTAAAAPERRDDRATAAASGAADLSRPSGAWRYRTKVSAEKPPYSHSAIACATSLGSKLRRTRQAGREAGRHNGAHDERFIQSALREWAYGVPYGRSSERTAMLKRWTHHYNWHRPHQGIGGHAPISRLNRPRNNLLTVHT